ncbi:MAG: CRTAC1 family protein [Myxococcota bacterium]
MLLLALACTPKPPADEAVSCDPAPSAAWSGEPAYEDHTSEWGLADVRGGRLQAVDLDGDRYPDLVVTEVYSNARDDLDAGVRYHWVLHNDGGEGFVDVSEESGLLVNRDGTLGSSTNVWVFGDVDADGDLDAFAGRYVDEGAGDATGDCSEIYLNDGAGHFTLATQTVCTEGMATSGASFTDVDADGNLDLWVVAFYDVYGALASDQSQLFRGNGDGTFTEVTEDAGLKLAKGRSTEDYLGRDVRRPAYGATACDVDGDAFPELLSSNYGRSWNHLWHNDGAGVFFEYGEAAGFDADDDLDYTDNTRYACWYEAEGTQDDPEPTADCDGWPPDYWTPGYDDQPARLGGNTFTTVCADVDNDGDADLLNAEIVHKWAGGSSDASGLLYNDGDGVFARADNEANGLARNRPNFKDWNEGDITAALLDFDNDGWKDVLIGSSDYEDTQIWLWRQVSPGQFEEASDASGLNHPWPAGLAIADFDLDGDLDVVTGSSTARTGTPWTEREVHLYENVRDAGNWLRIEGLPVGVRVDVTAGGLTQTQEVSGGYGHMGIQNDVALHFGLGDACLVDEVTATWPGGATETRGPLAGNEVLTW